LLARVVRRSDRQAAPDDLGLNPSAAPIALDDEAPNLVSDQRTAGARRRAQAGREAKRAAEAHRREKAAREAKIRDLEAQRAEAERDERDAQKAHEAERERLLARLSAAERWRREAEEARHAAVTEIEARLRNAESARDDAEGRAAGKLEAVEAALRNSEDARRRAESALTEAERANDAARQVYTAQLQAKVEETTRRLAEQHDEAERAAARAAAEAADYESRIAELEMAGETDGAKRDAPGRLELNTASVESLRDLGLSITQAARLVSRREAVGGFGSVDDLQSVPGIPPEHLATLLESAYIDPALRPDSP
jgi:DNA uptake protein ComE-like DNA-binding protein